jgi:hypothetical protein
MSHRRAPVGVNKKEVKEKSMMRKTIASGQETSDQLIFGKEIVQCRVKPFKKRGKKK